MWIDGLLLGGGLALLVAGGEALVRGASAVALRLGVAPVLVGLTVVAFGTSTPELVVNLAAAVRGTTDIGFGNVVGSNIANIGLLLGITALVSPMVIHRTIVVREIPMMILGCLAAVVLGAGGLGAQATLGFGRDDGLMLLLLFAVFLYYTVGEALQQRNDAFVEAVRRGKASGARPRSVAPSAARVEAGPGEEAPVRGNPGGWASALLVLGGLVLLVTGGEATLRGAIGLAEGLGVDEALIALTVVAIGTSLPELATSLVAAARGSADVAIGNIVGSNIYNILFVWGLSTAIAPSALPGAGLVDLAVMTAFSIVLLPLVLRQHRLGRGEGALMLAAYVGYVGWLVAG